MAAAVDDPHAAKGHHVRGRREVLLDREHEILPGELAGRGRESESQPENRFHGDPPSGGPWRTGRREPSRTARDSSTARRLPPRVSFAFAMLKDFRKALAQEILLADGAMGTLLVSRGASPDQAKSPLNLTDPESVREVHDDYRDAGARLLTTNTWDANRVKLTAHEWGDSLEKIN